MARSALWALVVLVLVGCGGSAGEEVTLLASDAVPVRAVLHEGEGPGAAAVVLVPGRGRGLEAWDRTAPRLAVEGWTVLVLEVRDSPDPAQMVRDVAGALEYLGGGGRVALIGEREGAAAVLWAASQLEVAAVVALSATDGALLEGRIRRIREPKLLAAAVGDREAVDRQEGLAADAPPPVVVRAYPGRAEGSELLEEETVMTDILAFLHPVLEVP